MLTILAFLFVLGVLIFVHELGHFLAARRHGVRVLTFSLGFGPKILKATRGDTEYCISAIPLGGYVKMAGENPDDPRSGQPDEFLSKTKWQRLQIYVAGPAMNIILAVIVLAFVLAQGAEREVYRDEPPVIGTVLPDSPAARAGLRRNDRIVAVAGRNVATWQDLFVAIGTRPDRDVGLTYTRDGKSIDVTVRPVGQGEYEIGNIGVLPDIHPVVASLIPGEHAEAAGFKAGDVIVAVNGERMVTRNQLIELTARSAGRTLEFSILRDGKALTLTGTPQLRGSKGMMGFYLGEPTKMFKPGPLTALRLSVERNVELSGLLFRILGGLFTGETSIRDFQGPVGIGRLSGEAAQEGFVSLLSLMALLSLQLGIINLMPVPILDGGHILIMGLEGIARRDFSMQVKEKMLLAGFVVLMMLMVTVIYNDLTRISWIERFMPWRN
ncbi:MAG TPA: RIP metalloprotease RseP, partial [Vicinamibacterales bacterium]|nr:RIP metalloprotease RseP [Vicinamibacterales bacterium]